MSSLNKKNGLNPKQASDKTFVHGLGEDSEGLQIFKSHDSVRGNHGIFDMDISDKKYRKLMDYALFLLGIKRYTSKELYQKMKDKLSGQGKWRGRGIKTMKEVMENEPGMAESDLPPNNDEEYIQAVLNRLRELNYVNDDSYAKDYISDRINNRQKGKRTIKVELMKKGISSEEIEKYYSENEVDEEGTALEAARKKLEKITKYPPEKQKAKIVYFLASKGFSGSIVYDVIGKLFKK